MLCCSHFISHIGGGNDFSVVAPPLPDGATMLSGIGYLESTGGFKFAGFDSNIPVLL